MEHWRPASVALAHEKTRVGASSPGNIRMMAMAYVSGRALEPNVLVNRIAGKGICADGTTDESLVVRIAKGDKRALQILYCRHNVFIYRFVMRFLSDEASAEDVVSDVFLAVWRRAERFERRSQVSTCLLAIARNKALSRMRAHDRATGRGNRRVGRGPCRRSGSDPAEGAAPGDPARLPDTAFSSASRNRRSRLLSRQEDRGGGHDPRRAVEHGEDPDVLCAQADRRADCRQGPGAGAHLRNLSLFRQLNL